MTLVMCTCAIGCKGLIYTTNIVQLGFLINVPSSSFPDVPGVNSAHVGEPGRALVKWFNQVSDSQLCCSDTSHEVGRGMGDRCRH